MSLNIEIKTIPHEKQRYDTVGDWYLEDGIQKFRISELSNKKLEIMIAIHELIEQALCEADGITEKQVDEFDKTDLGDDAYEHGDQPDAPYRNQHCFATGVERLLCAAFNIIWKEYEKELNNL